MMSESPPTQPAPPSVTRAGTVAVVGKPNAGKSTLLNRIVGQKLSITSPKPQSTRTRVVGIHSANGCQMILTDTPGLLEPRYALQKAMRWTALEVLRDADVILYLSDAAEGAPRPLAETARLDRPPRAPIVTVLNKIDLIPAPGRDQLTIDCPLAHQISARNGEGVARLIDDVAARLPESPFLFPEEEIGTQSVRFFVSELVRESALEQLDEEVPYSVACEVEEFREERRPLYIRAVIYVERESQKGILIGDGGARIREIGRSARLKIEQLVDAPVYLDLWVKVLANWRRNARSLERFGFTLPKEERA
ncbi:MAG: GTPase Era [Gemmatimonadota bacterium]|nr:GTPase Era [Gemmatimonadota bacterium]